MTADLKETKKAGRWDYAGAILLAALIGIWLLAYTVVVLRAWLGAPQAAGNASVMMKNSLIVFAQFS
jgi:hypothetical protein